ncbi:MAG: S49 family peptidase, partial [Pseudomonadales bacterium]|nr:S49 family peptidase [Pseudomonadales bacterium]
MSRFFRGIWNLITALKNALGNLIFLAIVIFILFAIISTETVTVPDSAALVLSPSGIIVDQKRAIDPLNDFLWGYQSGDSETLLKDILDAIDEAREDDRIKALVLDLEDLRGASMSKLEEIGNALDDFKQTGKPVYAFARQYSQSQYYIASHADRVLLKERSMPTLGGVFLTGLGSYQPFFKSAIDKLKINFHVFKVGEFKSAIEPFTRDDMSEEAKQNTSEWLGVLWRNYADTITSHRDITHEAFEAYTNRYDELLGQADNDPVKVAVDHGLVDEMIKEEDWIRMMQNAVGEGETDESFRQIDFKNYLQLTRPAIPAISPAGNKIAVITAKGTILDGEQPAGDIGSESISKLIRRAREDESIKALVLDLEDLR